MAYERLDNMYIAGRVWDEAAITHIDDSFERVYDDLYDIKVNDTWEFVYTTAENLLDVDYDSERHTSSFSGWWGCVGKPQNFNKIIFPVKQRVDYPIGSITVKIVEVPPLNEVTIGDWGVTPQPIDWNILAERTVTIPEDRMLSTDSYNLIEVDFADVITNEKGSYLYLAILCDTRATLGYFLKNYPDIEYNPWTYYATNGAQKSSPLAGGDYDSTSKDVYSLACEFYYKASSTNYLTVGTSKKDKFFNLVNECINNSDSFGEIFQEKYKYNYACGSLDLTRTTATSYTNTASGAFTGVVFPVGVVPTNFETAGVLLQVKSRSRNDSTTPITKVHAFLYSVDNVPLTETYEGKQFSELNPILLRSGVAECNVAVNEEDVVYIGWNEGSFKNEEGKFLMLGYECDSYNYRCVTGTRGSVACSSIDGHTYGDLETWYSTSMIGGQRWRPRWVDSSANAWSFVASEKYYDLGEKFYSLLGEALDEKLGDVSLDVNIAPTSEVRLAKEYDLVVGDKFQLYYEGVIKAFDALHEGIYVYCSVGTQYPRYWEFTPTAANAGKTYELQMLTRQLDGSVISSGKTKINVHAKLTNETTPQNLRCLIFGDSLTDGAKWQIEGLRRIYGTDMSISPPSLGITNTLTTYGKKTHTKNSFTVNHEGYGGWQWSSFLNPERGSDSTINAIIVNLSAPHGYAIDTVQKSIWTDNNGKLWELEDFPSETQLKFNRGSGNDAAQKDTPSPTTMTCSALSLSITPASVVWETTNPFYDSAKEALDFKAHAAQYGVEKADIVTCLLTWNGGGGTIDFNQEAKISKHMTNAGQLLRAIHNDFPNAKIIVMGIQVSSTTGGSGHTYGADGGYADMWSTAFYAFDYDKALEELVTGDPELAEYCYYVDTKGQFDTRYCMPHTQVAVNTRVSDITELRGTNGVHPNDAGYYQIGDAFYRALTKVIPLTMETTTTE